MRDTKRAQRSHLLKELPHWQIPSIRVEPQPKAGRGKRQPKKRKK